MDRIPTIILLKRLGKHYHIFYINSRMKETFGDNIIHKSLFRIDVYNKKNINIPGMFCQTFHGYNIDNQIMLTQSLYII